MRIKRWSARGGREDNLQGQVDCVFSSVPAPDASCLLMLQMLYFLYSSARPHQYCFAVRVALLLSVVLLYYKGACFFFRLIQTPPRWVTHSWWLTTWVAWSGSGAYATARRTGLLVRVKGVLPRGFATYTRGEMGTTVFVL